MTKEQEELEEDLEETDLESRLEKLMPFRHEPPEDSLFDEMLKELQRSGLPYDKTVICLCTGLVAVARRHEEAAKAESYNKGVTDCLELLVKWPYEYIITSEDRETVLTTLNTTDHE